MPRGLGVRVSVLSVTLVVGYRLLATAACHAVLPLRDPGSGGSGARILRAFPATHRRRVRHKGNAPRVSGLSKTKQERLGSRQGSRQGSSRQSSGEPMSPAAVRCRCLPDEVRNAVTSADGVPRGRPVPEWNRGRFATRFWTRPPPRRTGLRLDVFRRFWRAPNTDT